jgi:hypothetical protein
VTGTIHATIAITEAVHTSVATAGTMHSIIAIAVTKHSNASLASANQSIALAIVGPDYRRHITVAPLPTDRILRDLHLFDVKENNLHLP